MEVLALDTIHSPKLAKGLLESAGARLRHLQLVIAESQLGSQHWFDFWRAVRACTQLSHLQLVFLPRIRPAPVTDREVTFRNNSCPQSAEASSAVIVVLAQVAACTNAVVAAVGKAD